MSMQDEPFTPGPAEGSSSEQDTWEDGLANLAAAQAQLYAYAADLRRAVAQERARRRELEQAYIDAVSVLAGAVEARDPYTGGHGARVSAYAVALARALGWSEAQVEEARLGGLVHDIGKLGVDDAILRKPGYLDDVEWQQMRRHPELGAAILNRAPFLARAVVFAHRHHERWDGYGYPDRQAGTAIPVGGRLMSVADAFDAMTSTRPYRPAMDPEHAALEVARGGGTQFDPEMATTFLAALRDGKIPLPGVRQAA
jgi:putative nucleotidyltransferase with HDIG domain